MHSAIKFIFDFPQVTSNWYYNSKYIVSLSVKNQEHLKKLIFKAKQVGVKVSVFREPDIGNEITSIALEPGNISKRLTSNLKLMLNNN